MTTEGPGSREDLLEIDPRENPDWAFARNRHILMKTSSSEFSCSAFSTHLRIRDGDFYGPNRDYPWQGLLVVGSQGRQYKVLDGIYLSVGIPIEAERVLAGPGKVYYVYRDARGEVFSLVLSLEQRGGTAMLRASAGRNCEFALLADMTPTDTWPQNPHSFELTSRGMLVRSPSVPMHLRVDGFDGGEDLGQDLHWKYKLGDGFRKWVNGEIVFISRERSAFLSALLHSPTGDLRIEVAPCRGAPAELDPGKISLPEYGPGLLARCLRLRLSTLARYGLSLDGTWYPEAGSWWFRSPWLRDALEGIRWNLEAYVSVLGWSTRLVSLIRGLISIARRRDGLPLIADSGLDRTSDAPPQLLNVALELAERLGSRTLLSESLELIGDICGRFLSGGTFSDSVLADSIVCSPANSSWIDSVAMVDGLRWPTRLPGNWSGIGLDPFEAQYGLVEVNALYLEALDRVRRICEKDSLRTPEGVDELTSVLASGFNRHFCSEGIPNLTLVPSLGLKDPTSGSPGVVAVSALMGIVYEPSQISRIWSIVERDLLVERSPVALGSGRMPFGILVRAGDEPYLGDGQYHGSVVWPRDTPYLIRLAKAGGKGVAAILVSNLDHMIGEGAVGYCQELFSLPTGGKGSGSEFHSNPVPVKNPAQYWSHWCDPYLDHLEELGLSGSGIPIIRQGVR